MVRKCTGKWQTEELFIPKFMRVFLCGVCELYPWQQNSHKSNYPMQSTRKTMNRTLFTKEKQSKLDDHVKTLNRH